MINEKIKVLLLMGPTASGKTRLSLEVSKKYPVEIVSVDSVLIYKDMNIGSAKPTISELNMVKHHLINILSPLQTYSVANFLSDLDKIIQDIALRGKIPLLVGGTMMYFNALLNGISTLPSSDPKIRAQLYQELTILGNEGLYAKLQLVDPFCANKISKNDIQRLIRALEVYEIAKVPMSILQKQDKKMVGANYEFLPLSIIPSDRTILKEVINSRFTKMLDNGLIDEVISLKNKYRELNKDYTSQRSVGYYQTWEYLEGSISYSELIDTGCSATRQLAKRQTTWLKSLQSINIASDELDFNKMYSNLDKIINEFLVKAYNE